MWLKVIYVALTKKGVWLDIKFIRWTERRIVRDHVGFIVWELCKKTNHFKVLKL